MLTSAIDYRTGMAYGQAVDELSIFLLTFAVACIGVII